MAVKHHRFNFLVLGLGFFFSMAKMDANSSLATAELKRQNFRNVLARIHESSSSVLLFTLQWEELHDHYQSLHNALEEREARVARVFEEKERGLKETEKGLEELRMEIERKAKEVELKELESRERHASIFNEVQLRREELDLVEERLRKRAEELERKDKNMLSREASVEARSEALKRKEEKFKHLLKEFEVLFKESRENYGSKLESEVTTTEYVEKRKEITVHSTPAIVDQAFFTLDVANPSQSNRQRIKAGQHKGELARKRKLSDLYVPHGMGSFTHSPDEIHQPPSHVELPLSEDMRHTYISAGDPQRRNKRQLARKRTSYLDMVHGRGGSTYSPDEIHQSLSHAELTSSKDKPHTCISDSDPPGQSNRIRVKIKRPFPPQKGANV